jgi:CCR4-NOT transcription complex subunit 9
MEQLVAALNDPETRENALLDLSKKRDMFSDLAPILWHSYGVIPALLQEIVSIYPLLSPPSLTAHASNRVCNALALLQCVASHPDTRALFLNGARARASRVHARIMCACCPKQGGAPHTKYRHAG